VFFLTRARPSSGNSGAVLIGNGAGAATPGRGGMLLMSVGSGTSGTGGSLQGFTGHSTVHTGARARLCVDPNSRAGGGESVRAKGAHEAPPYCVRRQGPHRALVDGICGSPTLDEVSAATDARRLGSLARELQAALVIPPFARTVRELVRQLLKAKRSSSSRCQSS
jgi:hypothetical protein